MQVEETALTRPKVGGALTLKAPEGGWLEMSELKKRLPRGETREEASRAKLQSKRVREFGLCLELDWQPLNVSKHVLDHSILLKIEAGRAQGAERTNKHNYSSIMEHYSTIKRNEFITYINSKDESQNHYAE